MELRYHCPRLAARMSSRSDCDVRRKIAKAQRGQLLVTRYIACLDYPGPIDTALAGLAEVVHGGRKAHRAASPERVIG